ncbi:hypothetical protein B566_EDAN012571 [Ephemera danica]|nr:hypothetical protein B566_EDAN012571 [Ephemera danica]
MKDTLATMKLQLILLLLVAAVWQVQGHKKNRFLVDFAKPNSVNDRIIGGQDASPGQFPYMADLWMSTGSFCGGSIVTVNRILTAGHCVEGSSYTDVYVGTHDIYDSSDPERQTYRSTFTAMHPSYNWPLNDIAVLHIPDMVFTSRIQPVRLPRRSDGSNLFVGQLTTLSGWGQTSDGGSISATLKYLPNQVVITTAECEGVYGGIVSTLLCTGTDGVNQGCLGDSGSPLVANYEGDGQPTEIGLFALISSPSCLTGPGGFTRLTDYFDWLESHGIPIRP